MICVRANGRSPNAHRSCLVADTNMWTNTLNSSGRSTRASTNRPILPADPSKQVWHTYLQSVRCSLSKAEEDVVNLILEYPAKGWCPVGDYLHDGRYSVSSRCDLGAAQVQTLMSMLNGKKEKKTMLKDVFRISAEPVYKYYWFIHFDRGKPPPTNSREYSRASGSRNRGGRIGPES